MKPSYMHSITRISVDRTEIKRMLRTMQQFGAHGWEVLFLWLGEVDETDGVATVTDVRAPQQSPITSENGVGYFVGSETLFHLNRELSESGLRLIAQVHSHPQEAYHSDADDRYAIVTAEGGYSFVVPFFGHVPPDPTLWAFYRLIDGVWTELREKARVDLLRLT